MATVELETDLRLTPHLARTINQYDTYLGGRTDRTHVITQALEIALGQGADFQTL
jgi:hypothetical protein